MAINYNSFVYDRGSIVKGKKEIKEITLNFGLFFDGTCNNLWNTEAREIYKGYKKPTYMSKKEIEAAKKAYVDYTEDESSHENDYTNVARLYQAKVDDEYAIYIEGAGTTSTKDNAGIITYGKDNSGGLGFGHGISGIRWKVRRACELLAGRIIKQKQTTDESKSLNKIILDVYGFSRGAAAARNFVYEVTSSLAVLHLTENVDYQSYIESKNTNYGSIPPAGFLGYYLKKGGIDLNFGPSIEIRFAGLFDTVSSYEPEGVGGTLGAAASHNFGDDVKQLHLNKLNDVKYILHLTAADEHRENFSGTTIDSALTRTDGTVIEIEMPGVHSDVGGSYNHNINEQVEVLDIGIVSVKNIWGIDTNLYDKENRQKMRMDYNHLIEQGWFRPRQCITNIDKNRWYELKFKRDGLSNRYSYIPLHLMFRYIEKWKIGQKSPYASNVIEPVISNTFLGINYPLTKGDFTPLPLFSVEGNVIHFKAGRIECKISKKEHIDSSPYIKDPHWVLSGNISNMRFSTWTECVQYLIKCMFDYIELFVPDSSEEPLKFASHYYLKTLPTLKYVYPTCIKYGVNLRKYKYITWNSKENKEQELLDLFKSDIATLNASVNEQIFIRRLRNRFLHWSSNYEKNVGGVTSSNFPRIVDKENITRERKVYKG